MAETLMKNNEYASFIKSVKQEVQIAQTKANVSVNRTLLQLYWYMGSKIVEKQKNSK